MKQTYRAAIIGLGNIAWRFDHNATKGAVSHTHASSYIKNERISLVGGCSPNKIDCKDFEEHFGLRSFLKFEELIESARPDIVSICSPSENHFDQVIYCIENEIPMIWLEKPPASSLQELDILIKKQSQYHFKSTILVNYQRRYSDSYRKLQSIYRDKVFGECVLVQVNYSKGLEINGSHIIDMIFYILGDDLDYRLDRVMTFGQTAAPCFSLLFQNGIGVMISGMTLPYHCIDIALVCASGRVSLLHGGSTLVIEEKVENKEYLGFYRLEKKEVKNMDQDRYQSGMEKALQDLIDCHEKKNPPASNLMTARNTQTVIHQVRERQKS